MDTQLGFGVLSETQPMPADFVGGRSANTRSSWRVMVSHIPQGSKWNLPLSPTHSCRLAQIWVSLWMLICALPLAGSIFEWPACRIECSPKTLCCYEVSWRLRKHLPVCNPLGLWAQYWVVDPVFCFSVSWQTVSVYLGTLEASQQMGGRIPSHFEMSVSNLRNWNSILKSFTRRNKFVQTIHELWLGCTSTLISYGFHNNCISGPCLYEFGSTVREYSRSQRFNFLICHGVEALSIQRSMQAALTPLLGLPKLGTE